MKRTTIRALMLCAAATTAMACGEKAKTEGNATAADKPPAEDYWKVQQRYADSVLATVKGPTDVVKKLGKGYDLGSTRLRDTVATLALKAKCFENARKTDPFLQGTATLWVNMSIIGSDLIQVQEPDSKWTSLAGNIVVACLNQAAKTWKFDKSFGKPGPYIVQIEFRSAVTAPGSDTKAETKADTTSAAKAPTKKSA